MNVDTLPGEPKFIFIAEALPEAGLHRVAIAAGRLDAGIRSALIAPGMDNALRVCAQLNRRLGHYRPSSAASASRCRRGGAVVTATPAGTPPADPALAIAARPRHGYRHR